jgi:hypothetical protein
MTGDATRVGAAAGRAGGPRGTPATRRGRVPRALLLFVLPAPLLLASIIALGAGRFGDMLADGLAFALCIAGAVLTRRGSPLPRRGPGGQSGVGAWLPRKTLGAACVAAGTAVAAYFGVGHGPAISLAFAAVSLLAFHLLYGLDPVQRPWRQGPTSPFDGVAEALEEAQARIEGIERSAARIGNPELRQRLGRIAGQGRDILDLIKRRPNDLRRARKFLTVYLEGAEQVTQGYASTHRLADSSELEQSFRNVLVTIEEVFGEQQKRLLDADLLDLDVKIEVLHKQLKREGIW